MNLLKKPYPYRYFQATLWIIIANVVVHLFLPLFMNVQYLAMNPLMVIEEGRWYQLVTYMFVHGSYNHLFFNMLALFFFGYPVEQKVGSWEFLTLYFATGILAGAFSLAVYWFSGQWYVLLVGASGAIYAILLFFAAYFPDQRIYVMFLLPVRATTLVLGYTAIELFNNFFGGGTGVAHLTHLAGFLFAAIYLALRLNRNILSILMGKRYYDDYY